MMLHVVTVLHTIAECNIVLHTVTYNVTSCHALNNSKFYSCNTVLHAVTGSFKLYPWVLKYQPTGRPSKCPVCLRMVWTFLILCPMVMFILPRNYFKIVLMVNVGKLCIDSVH